MLVIVSKENEKLIKFLYCECGVGLKVIIEELSNKGIHFTKGELSTYISDLGIEKGIVFSEKEVELINSLYVESGLSIPDVYKDILKLNKYRKLYHLESYIKANDLKKGNKSNSIISEEDKAIIQTMYSVEGAGVRVIYEKLSKSNKKYTERIISTYIQSNNLKKATKWSDDEYAILIKYFEQGGYKLCQEKGLNRVKKDIYSKARSKGLKVGRVTKRWTETEKEYVRDNIGILSYEEMGKHLGRSVMSISCWIQEDGLSSNNLWTDKEDAIIKEYYEEGGAKLCQEKGVERKLKSINIRANKLGIVVIKRWSEEEDALLREFYPIGGSTLCIKKGLKRSKRSIRYRAGNLGVESGLKHKDRSEWDYWSTNEVNILKKYYPIGGYRLCQEKGLNRPLMAVTNKAHSLRLRCEVKRGWLEKDINLLKEYYPKGGVKLCKEKGLKYATSSIYQKANSLGLKANR